MNDLYPELQIFVYTISIFNTYTFAIYLLLHGFFNNKLKMKLPNNKKNKILL